MVKVRISETYDLSTKVGKMGFVGIHTPTGNLSTKLWGGFFAQFKKVRFAKCDVAMACASMLPADPLQIGVSAGDIAPQDMFNPILYKAVSNDSMNNLQKWIAGQTQGSLSSTTRGDSVDATNNQALGGSLPQEQIYYSLLSNPRGWKKAMPQSGLVMNGLRPLVYQMISNYGANASSPSLPSSLRENWWNGMNDVQIPNTTASSPDYVSPQIMRGPPMPMPAFDTTSFSSPTNRQLYGAMVNGMFASSIAGSTENYVTDVSNTTPPPCYVGVIVLPPAKLNQLYYRLKVTWTLEFSGMRSLDDIMTWSGMVSVGSESYHTDYATQSANMASLTGMVDTDNADIVKVMEGAS